MALQRADDEIGAEAEQAVHQQAHHDDIGPHIVARVHDQVADAGGRVNLLGHDQREPGDAERVAQPDQERGQRGRQDDVLDQRGVAEAEAIAGFHQFLVDRADAGEEGEIDWEGGAEGDQRDFRRFADAEPQDEQGHQGEEGHGAQHLHRRVDGQFADPREAGGDGERGADGDGDGKPDDDAAERDEEVGFQFAGGQHRPEGAGDRRGGGENARRNEAGEGGELPQEQNNDGGGGALQPDRNVDAEFSRALWHDCPFGKI